MLAVVLSGGAGTRLWPVSREAMPKPFMRIGGGPSLLQRTALRAAKAGATRCMVVTNADYTFKTVEEFGELGERAPAELELLLEPVGRNTAPAIAELLDGLERVIGIGHHHATCGAGFRGSQRRSLEQRWSTADAHERFGHCLSAIPAATRRTRAAERTTTNMRLTPVAGS